VALHQTGEKLSSCIPFSGNTDPQEKGKEITYAKRYNINAIFNVIVGDEDNDANKQIGNYKKNAVDGKLAAEKLLKAATRDEAMKIYKGLSEAERNTTEVVAATAEIKAKYGNN
jgi:predicted nucleotide-binding protein (sugar kinase/HSP70/actin superfamily)